MGQVRAPVVSRRFTWWLQLGQSGPQRTPGVSHSTDPRYAQTLTDVKASNQPFLTPECQSQFLATCWRVQLGLTLQATEVSKHQSYFRHYEEFCTYIPTAYRPLEDCTHDHFCKAVQLLSQGTRQTCEASIQALIAQYVRDPDAARDCVNFIGEAILLINLREWTTGETLKEFVARNVASRSIQKDQYRIPLSFNARAFEQLANIRVIWTRDLLSHLEIGLKDSTLAIFHNVKVLQLYEQSALKDIFPDDFLDETKRTLALMLPVADKTTVKWFTKKQTSQGLDIAASNCRHLRATHRNIQDFDFWRDRLIIAKETFDLSQPRGLLQFWRDDRNKVQWWTFWIAIVVFFLTLAGVLEGALQVYKAYYPS